MFYVLIKKLKLSLDNLYSVYYNLGRDAQNLNL